MTHHITVRLEVDEDDLGLLSPESFFRAWLEIGTVANDSWNGRKRSKSG
jgi:hypothetical protein